MNLSAYKLRQKQIILIQEVHMNMDLIKKSNMLNKFIKSNWRKSLNEPSEILKHKFIDPAAVYRGQLWDWNSFFFAEQLFWMFMMTPLNI